MPGLTREQMLADPLYRASRGLPPLRPAPEPTYSEPEPMRVHVPDWMLPTIGDQPPPPGAPPPPPTGPHKDLALDALHHYITEPK